MAESKENDVEMVAEGEGTEDVKEGEDGEETKSKEQAQKDKDLLTFEGIGNTLSARHLSLWGSVHRYS